jgi:hypothetical protein
MKNKLTLAGLLMRVLLALLAVTAFLPALRAQTPHRRVANRVLLVFDTSSAMKKRLPEEERGIRRLFALTLSSQLQSGDTIGVWTFDQNLRMGEFPLQYWQAEDINTISSNILTFVEKHHYSKTTSFEKLMPKLNEIMAGSPRLTTLIFCDGEAPIRGTPVDDSINSIFKKNEALMRKDREPYVLVFRTESGNYVGSMINTAASINVPQFPLPPTPPPPPPLPPPVPEPTVPPLIIIGRSAGTNVPPPAPAPAPTQVQMQPPPPAPVATSNTSSLIVIMPPPHPAVKTNAVPETNPAPAAVTAPPTNIAPPPEVMTQQPVTNFMATATATETPESRGEFIAIVVGILVVIGVVGYVISRRGRRRNSSSLITESLKKK